MRSFTVLLFIFELLPFSNPCESFLKSSANWSKDALCANAKLTISTYIFKNGLITLASGAVSDVKAMKDWCVTPWMVPYSIHLESINSSNNAFRIVTLWQVASSWSTANNAYIWAETSGSSKYAYPSFSRFFAFFIRFPFSTMDTTNILSSTAGLILIAFFLPYVLLCPYTISVSFSRPNTRISFMKSASPLIGTERLTCDGLKLT